MKTTDEKKTAVMKPRKCAGKKATTAEKAPRDRKIKGLFIRRLQIFSCSAPAGAQVFLAGSFNDWKADVKPMAWDEKKQKYTCRLYLLPGEYEYKFVVNGNWVLDEANPEKRWNNLDSFNSLLIVK